MKKSELKSLIRESIRELVVESDDLGDIQPNGQRAFDYKTDAMDFAKKYLSKLKFRSGLGHQWDTYSQLKPGEYAIGATVGVTKVFWKTK